MHPPPSPLVIDVTKERKNPVLAGSLSGFRAVADLYDEQVRAVLGRFALVVRPATDAVAEEGRCAKEQARRIAFGMRRDRANNVARQASERLLRHNRKFADARWSNVRRAHNVVAHALGGGAR